MFWYKGRIPLTNQMNFWKSSKKGGVIFNPKNYKINWYFLAYASLHKCDHIYYKKIQKWGEGGSKAVWNFSKNSSDLVAGSFPDEDTNSKVVDVVAADIEVGVKESIYDRLVKASSCLTIFFTVWRQIGSVQPDLGVAACSHFGKGIKILFCICSCLFVRSYWSNTYKEEEILFLSAIRMELVSVWFDCRDKANGYCSDFSSKASLFHQMLDIFLALVVK